MRKREEMMNKEDLVQEVQEVMAMTQKLCEGLEANRGEAAEKLDLAFSIDVGKKYLKLIYSYERGGASVHAFVDKITGDMYKAASWKAPAKGVRFNLYKDLDTLVKLADTYGSYLYANSACSQVAKAVQFNKENEWRK